MKKILYGRELLFNEIPAQLQTAIKNKDLKIQKKSAAQKKHNKTYCQRCQAEMIPVDGKYCICKQTCGYCLNCIQMGKVRACQYLYSIKEENDFDPTTNKLLEWKGELSEQQKFASEKVKQAIYNKHTLLLWAVTGAGKTEMLFLGIEQALQEQKRICIATPRIDVALELEPRIQAAFPNVPISLLYGAMEEDYKYTQIVISTIHQLYRFKAAFDVLIIDEIDAFPFHLDDHLQYAADKARKVESTLIYLTATPNPKLQKSLRNKEIEGIILPARYHRHPLPVPEMKWCVNWSERVLKYLDWTSFGKKLKTYIKTKKKFLVFVPNIEWMQKLEQLLRIKYPTAKFDAVWAEDSLRKEKIQKMRKEKIQFLLSTTILERGVTFPNINVLVIGAEDRIFTEAALVQIAGRCGRSADYPKGEIYFFHDGKSRAMKKACKQIKEMNKKALERGLIDG